MTEAVPEWAHELGPLDTRPLFRPLLNELIGLLRGLNPTDWERQTVAPEWRVRDVAAHLLDGDLRRLAASRDGHRPAPPFPIQSDPDLVRFINGLNAVGVAFASWLSPRLLVDLLTVTGEWTASLFDGMALNEPALWAVSWAGEVESENWMDIGRDYTERWHHQMQIRDAVGAARLLAPPWMVPLLDLSVRALPVAYAGHAAPEGTTVTLEVHGPTSGAWSLIRSAGRFRVVRGRPKKPDALVRITADDAWRLFYNAVKRPELTPRIEIHGDADLARPLLDARSVIV